MKQHLSVNRPFRREVLDCASPLALFGGLGASKSGRGLPQSKTLARGSWPRWTISKSWRRSLLTGLAALLGLCAGCANVKPWERDALAHYSMRPDRDPVTLSLREHMWFSREAANGGRSVGGGGCGCN